MLAGLVHFPLALLISCALRRSFMHLLPTPQTGGFITQSRTLLERCSSSMGILRTSLRMCKSCLHHHGGTSRCFASTAAICSQYKLCNQLWARGTVLGLQQTTTSATSAAQDQKQKQSQWITANVHMQNIMRTPSTLGSQVWFSNAMNMLSCAKH